jgi:Rrf2 family transcriptional regulator, iron-sulfur cluster assembly transcription factor
VQITRATDYATRVMIFLAALPPAAKAQSAAIALATDVPISFLSKVMQRLVSAGLVTSSRGSGGGFGLAVPRGRITLLDILETFEGETRLNLCLAHGPSCDRKSRCPAHSVWEEAQRALVGVLRQASLEKLALAAFPSAKFRGKEVGTEATQPVV